jgi:ADP-ribosylation factor related protein 1
LERIKSTYGLTSLKPEQIPPTVGMNLARLNIKGNTVIFWDLGGQIKMRSKSIISFSFNNFTNFFIIILSLSGMWEKYYDEADAVMFVVDSADIGRLEEAKLAYDSVCEHDSLSRVPVLTIANKQDLPEALSSNDLSINFYPIQDSAEKSKVFAVSAITGQGFQEAINAVVAQAQRHCRNTR